MPEISDHGGRIAAALRGAIAAHPRDGGAGHDMLAVAESIAVHGGLDVGDLRQRQLADALGAALLVRVLPFGLATPLDRPRLRRDAYRCAAAAGADEGTTLVCVAAALVAADLLRFDPAMTAIRVRQSLLEDAPMALLNRLTIVDPEIEVIEAESDPGAALQLALSELEWTGCAGVASALARLGEAGRGDVGTLTAALAGAAAGQCDVPVEDYLGERADRAAQALATLGAAAL
ncbi:MAG: hypothetical protein DLM65_14545 [Candidatus Aeolococcus gillhamiae]|uniref:Uncharacterized protein n=1 Tax=Candidatus Aeolococcus gillhamiae TaxID=3127015 RepID=A0A2W5Z1B3_9BACT|nr:MAG: hypothetical protein DLM65_14545 [Candidatus Dormibacter sp. RRmetagenome_bin12]